MKNWKTFLAGLLLSLPAIITPITEKRAPTAEEYIQIVGSIGLGTAAKDKDVTGAGTMAHRVDEK